MGVGIDFWLQLAVLLACLFFAAPRGGMTLGMMAASAWWSLSSASD